MRTTTYEKKMLEHRKAFERLWKKMVEDTNSFIKDNPEIRIYNLGDNIEKFSDNLCLSGAWIQDRINRRSGAPSNPRYRGSLTKKIRKSLGYTI